RCCPPSASRHRPPALAARRTRTKEPPVRWSVGIEAEGTCVLTREQVVDLADAVAASAGIATGIGSTRDGAQLLVEGGSREEEISKATAEFERAASVAGLPKDPIVRAEAVSEAEEADDQGGPREPWDSGS